MSLNSALYTGTSGLKVHGDKMSVIGNNIANVNTIGFKSSRMDFEDAMYQAITTASGTDQVGRGASIGALMTDFSQGSMQSTNDATDLAIGGDGFFIVSPKGEALEYYSRAGNFRFDEEGYLVDPHGYVVQGWEIAEQSTSQAATADQASAESSAIQTVGSYRDIRLENFQSPPEATEQVQVITNLDSRSEDKSLSDYNPFFAMYQTWDANEDTPLSGERYSYQTTNKVYDENGSPHDVSIYFDKVQEDISDPSGSAHWEYMATVDPNEENRSFWETASDTSKKGVLMTGTLTFNSAGQLTNMNSFTIRDGDEETEGMQLSDPSNPGALANWRPAQFNNEGYPIFTANFTGSQNADATNMENANNIALNFGAKAKNLEENYDTYPYMQGWSTTSLLNGQNSSIGDISSDPGNLPSFEGFELDALSVTNYSSSSTTYTQSQDGYPPGDLQNISVSRDGVITGNYSNGQVLELYALTLADFNNTQALRREGGNLFTETRDTGAALTGLAGTAGLGSVSSKSLEQSNVDMSEEFVSMITTQKGFQANSRTITTTNTMLDEVLRLVR